MLRLVVKLAVMVVEVYNPGFASSDMTSPEALGHPC